MERPTQSRGSVSDKEAWHVCLHHRYAPTTGHVCEERVTLNVQNNLPLPLPFMGCCRGTRLKDVSETIVKSVADMFKANGLFDAVMEHHHDGRFVASTSTSRQWKATTRP